MLARRDAGAKGKRGKLAPAAVPEAVPSPLPVGDGDFLPPPREVLRPANQLQLSEAELNEELAKMLTANNPAAPQNVARFNMKERCYKFEPMVEQQVVHYASDGWLLHKSSDEARKQAEVDKAEAEANARFAADMERALKEKAAGLDVELPSDSRQLRNQFNYSERAAQTFTYPMRDRATFTEPPPTATASGSCSLWEIYDEYRRDLERQRAEEAAKGSKGAKKLTPSASAAGASAAAAAAAAGHGGADTAGGGGPGGNGRAPGGGAARDQQQEQQEQWAAAPGVLDGLRMLDRMVNQNTFADVAMDFKYWDDASDAFRPGEGSLLPLWQFGCVRGRKHVTALAWSPLYADLFAVGYGSFHYQRQGAGGLSLISLKNPSHPELHITTESGVMALQFHPEFANLLAVGCYNGSVSVYDARAKHGQPLYTAAPKAQRHTAAVWQVVWQVDELQKTLQFVSVSTDGEVLLWSLTKCELTPERLMRLSPPPAAGAATPGAAAAAAAQPGSSAAAAAGVSAAAGAAAAELLPPQQAVGGLCMDFSQAGGQEHVYLVGTEAGSVHRCSKAYSSDYLASYAGHAMPVYAVRWNGLHAGTFLSCSADWSVKVWDVAQEVAPVMSFDLGAAVGDVAWAPYSSTVFAAATDDGRVAVFDLAQNRQLPLCFQKCAKKARLTRIAFNAHYPILLVGDSHGNVQALKLSPNLRKCGPSGGPAPNGGGALAAKPASAAPPASKPEQERAKMDKVLEVARRSQAPVLRAAAGE